MIHLVLGFAVVRGGLDRVRARATAGSGRQGQQLPGTGSSSQALQEERQEVGRPLGSEGVVRDDL